MEIRNCFISAILGTVFRAIIIPSAMPSKRLELKKRDNFSSDNSRRKKFIRAKRREYSWRSNLCEWLEIGKDDSMDVEWRWVNKTARHARLSATCRRGWLTNYGYALRKRRASAIVTWMERSVSLSLGCDVVGGSRVPRDQRTSRNIRERERKIAAGLIRTRGGGGGLLLLFFLRSFAATLYSRPDNLRPLI